MGYITCAHCGGTGICRNWHGSDGIDGCCDKCGSENLILKHSWMYGYRKECKCSYCNGNGRVSEEDHEKYMKNYTDKTMEKGGYV